MRWAFVALGLLAACADAGAQRQAAASRFIGRPEAELVRTLGAPARTTETGGKRLLAYVERRLISRPIALGGPWRPGLPPAMRQDELVELVCDTSFEVAGGVVTAVRLAGNGCD